jgi:F-type H+-transporting ATPase subunit delta
MAEESVSRRYAQALVNQALLAGGLETISKELGGVAQAIDGSPQLSAFLGNPLITRERKKSVIGEVFAKEAGASTMGFLNLLVDKRRIDLFSSVKSQFDEMVRAHNGIVFATATSAVALTPAQAASLEKALEARTGKDIELTTAVDPSLMGGILVRIGDTVLDGTVKGKLERLREQLQTRK